MSSRTAGPAAAITVTAGKGDTPTAYYEAVWHEPKSGGGTRPAKQRIGKAWLDFDGRGDDGRARWRKRPGRVPDGFFDERRAHAAAPDAQSAWRARQAAKAAPADPLSVLTFRELAHEWLRWLRDVKGAKPTTVRDYTYMLREPGAAAARGSRVSEGRVMVAFGDRRVIDVTVRDVSQWLAQLDAAGLKPRLVNKHRQVVASIFAYARKPDTYALTVDPVTATDKRREPPQRRLEVFTVEEAESLARAAAAGAWRRPRGRASAAHRGPDEPSPLTEAQRIAQAEEAALRAAEDQQDAELFRVLFYSGLRLGEARALRRGKVTWAQDMSGAVLHVDLAVSGTEEGPPKSGQPRDVPVPRPGAEALARVFARADWTGDNHYVFVGRTGGRLDDSAIRRRFKAARDAAGVPELPLHGLRHSAGSMIATSAGATVARDVLGHSDVRTTNRYLHGRIDARAIAVMNAAYGVAESEVASDDVTETFD